MAKNYFPINYKSVYSMTQTRTYIAGYLKTLLNAIERNRNAVYVDPPVATSHQHNWDAFISNQRLVTFDNKYSYELNQMYNDASNYMQHVLLTSINSADTAIYTYAPIINRDGATINESIVNYNIYIEMYASHAIVLDDLINQIANNFMAGVKKVNLELNINKDKLPEYTNQSINFITIDKLIKTYPTISLKEAIDRYTISNGATAVIGACREIEGKSLFVGLPTADDYDHTTVLYVLNETNNTATPIVKISSRPKIEVINKQILEDIPEVMDANIYQETILKERNDEQNTIGVTVYFSNIMLINLKKYHISEVVHAPWPKDFVEYVTKNKIEIM